MNVKLNNIVLMVLPRMIKSEIEFQENLLQQELDKYDTRYEKFRNELIIALRDLYQDIIIEEEERKEY